MNSTINNNIERMSFDKEKNIASDNDCLLDHKQCANKNAESRVRVRTLCIFSVFNGLAVIFHALLVFNPNWPWHGLCNDRVSISPQLRTERTSRFWSRKCRLMTYGNPQLSRAMPSSSRSERSTMFSISTIVHIGVNLEQSLTMPGTP